MRSRMGVTRNGRAGFTLVELLAVIAIIGILAAIVVPQVTKFMADARMARAVSEVRNAETALVGALSNTGRSDFRDFLSDAGRATLNQAVQQIEAGNFAGVRAAADFYREFFYELLRQGRDSEFIKLNVDPEVRQKLGTFYMDIGKDPWGQQYNFWMGPLRGQIPLRSFRIVNEDDPDYVELDDPNFTSANAYVYDAEARQFALQDLPGQPRADDASFQDNSSPFGSMFPNLRAYGFPAPDELPVYIWSSGPNALNDANVLFQMNRGDDVSAPDFLGGGDDPNNWDRESGWEAAPKV